MKFFTPIVMSSRRHPCEVTSDRLMDHLEKYLDKFDGKERDAISSVRFMLQEIADGNR